jgi:acetyltransferase-like isoleucine patch superfamily enzyme
MQPDELDSPRPAATPGRPALRQPVAQTVRDVLARAWMGAFGRLAPLAPVFMHLAGLPLGPYKDKRRLLRWLGGRAYISPRAQVHCRRLEIGRGAFIDDGVTVYAHPRALGGITLGPGVHLYRWTILELGEGRGSIHIGANTHVQAGCTLNAYIGSVSLGADCMIGAHCAFIPYQHGFADLGRPMRAQTMTSRGDVVLEDDVWLGTNVSVQDGVRIGRGAIVGAGAVVTHDLPPNAIAGGVPARVLRMRA